MSDHPNKQTFGLSRPRPAANKAFTFVELLMVIVLIGIMAAAVVPSVLETSDTQAVGAARLITGDLQYAQNQAIATRTPVTVTFSAAGNSYQLSDAGGVLTNPMSKGTYTVAFGSSRELSQVDVIGVDFDGATTVTFDEMGAPGAGGTITIQSGARVMKLSVADATGLVTVSE